MFYSATEEDMASDDALVSSFLAAEKQYLVAGPGMSQEGLFFNSAKRAAKLHEMREKLADDLARMTETAKLELQDAKEADIRASTRAERVEERVALERAARAEAAKKAAAEAAELTAEKKAARAARWAKVKNVGSSVSHAFHHTPKPTESLATATTEHLHDILKEAHVEAPKVSKSALNSGTAIASKFKWRGPVLAMAGVAYLSAFGLIVGACAVGMVKLLNMRSENKQAKEEVISEIRKEILKTSKPNLKVSFEGGDKEKLGRLMINGRPASQVRSELEKIVASDKSLTPEEYARCVATVRNSGDKFLHQLDALNNTAKTYQNSQSIATGGIVGMYVVFGALAFVCWLGYRVYQFLIRKLT